MLLVLHETKKREIEERRRIEKKRFIGEFGYEDLREQENIARTLQA
jgi:hypothetical protein